jgi:hypothetical protein
VPNAARAAKNESVYREVNEHISELEERFGAQELTSFVCECSLLECHSPVQATLDEYRAVRAEPMRFLVLHAHVDPDYERVVTRTDRFSVVEKFGLSGDVAREEA